MKQLFYTSCIAGRSLSGNSGFQVRAATEGLTAEEIRYATMYASYVLPGNHRPTPESVKTAPVRLAIFDTDELGQIICHSVYVGKDPVTGRWGNFFSHVLLDVPEDVVPSQVIRCWGSDFWHRCDREGPTVLEEVSGLPPGDGFSKDTVKSFLEDEGTCGLLEFILSALVENSDSRIIVSAPTDLVITAVRLIMKTLSRQAADGITFSTYESDPLSCPAKISATCWIDSAGQPELPSSAYSGEFRAFNFYSGRKSPVKQSSFARFAIKSLQTGDGLLEKFQAICSQLRVESVRLHAIIHNLLSDSSDLSVSADDIELLLDNNGVTTWLLSKEKSANRLVKVACELIEDENYYETLAPQFTKAVEDSDLLDGSPSLTDPELLERCRAWFAAERYRESPSISVAGSEDLAEALVAVPRKSAQKLIKSTIPVLSERMATAQGLTVEQLASVVKRLGHYLEGGESSLFRMIVADLAKRASEKFKVPQLSSAIAGVLCDPVVRKKMAVRQAKTIARQIKAYGGSNVMKAIHKRARTWPRSNRHYWLKLTRWDRWRPHIIRWVLIAGCVLSILFLVLVSLYSAKSKWPGLFEWLPDVRQVSKQEPND